MSVHIGKVNLVLAAVVFLSVSTIAFISFSSPTWPLESLKDAINFILQGLLQFSLTLAGFLFTALSILLVFESKPWFDRIRKTPPFKGFVQKIQWTIILSIVLFCLVTLSGASLDRVLQDRSLVGMVVGPLLGITSVIVFWSIGSVRTLVSIASE